MSGLVNSLDGEPWMQRGLCREHHDPDIWYGATAEGRREARRICGTCPVRLNCLEYALSGRGRGGGEHRRVREMFGIWGGINMELPKPAKFWKDLRAKVEGLPRG